MEQAEEKVLTLRSLLSEYDVEKLANAIEMHGVYTYDEFGRFVRADEKSQDIALKLLANVYEYESNIDGQQSYEQHPMDISSGPGDYFSLFGWSRDALPNFDQIESDISEFSEPLHTINRKAPDGFIAALMRLIVDLAKQDPDFNIENMPGTRKDFFEVAIKIEPYCKSISFNTFKDYIKPFLKFRKGARSMKYYQEKLGILIQTREEDSHK